MIRVTVELVPFGIEEKARKIGSIIISNDGSGTKTYGNYRASLKKGGREYAAEVKNFPRLQSKVDMLPGVFALLFEVLVAVKFKEFVQTYNLANIEQGIYEC